MLGASLILRAWEKHSMNWSNLDLEGLRRSLTENFDRLGPVRCHERVYRGSPGVSQSTLKHMRYSPAKCLWEMNHPRPPSPAMELGRAIHAALLEPETFNAEWCIRPKFDRRTKDGKAAAEEWERKNAGRQGIDATDMDTVNNVAARVFDNDFYGRFFKAGEKECSFWSEDAEHRIIKRCRLDNYIPAENMIVDLKTTECAQPEAFQRDIWKYLYHVQAAYYTDIVREVTGKNCSFFIVAVEKTKDCDVTVHLVGDDAIANGRAMYKKWLAEYVKCFRADVWPGYKEQVNTYQTPAWATEYSYEF